jgi:hypothetical protein
MAIGARSSCELLQNAKKLSGQQSKMQCNLENAFGASVAFAVIPMRYEAQLFFACIIGHIQKDRFSDLSDEFSKELGELRFWHSNCL